MMFAGFLYQAVFDIIKIYFNVKKKKKKKKKPKTAIHSKGAQGRISSSPCSYTLEAINQRRRIPHDLLLM